MSNVLVRLSSMVVKRVPADSVPPSMLVGYREPEPQIVPAAPVPAPAIIAYLAAEEKRRRESITRQFGSTASFRVYRARGQR